MKHDSPVVLAAEDEETDRFILRLAFQKAGLPAALVAVSDGQEAMDYLAGSGAYADRAYYPLPSLLILDLKMPRLSGFDVLAWLATRAEFKNLPVVILSSSSDQSDVQNAKALGARDYFVKPNSLPDLVQIIQRLRTRWFPPELLQTVSIQAAAERQVCSTDEKRGMPVAESATKGC